MNDQRRGLRRSQPGEYRRRTRADRRTKLLTVYTIVNALTANLPAVKSVQLLVNGKEVDTLAGHIDLRKPLEKDLSLVEP